MEAAYLRRAQPVLAVAAAHDVDEAAHDLAGVRGARRGHGRQLPPPPPRPAALLGQLEALHAVQPLLVGAALAADAADDVDGVVDGERPGPAPGQQHAGAAAPPLPLAVEARDSVDGPGAGGAVRVHLLAPQQVDVVLHNNILYFRFQSQLSHVPSAAASWPLLTLWPTSAVQLRQLCTGVSCFQLHEIK